MTNLSDQQFVPFRLFVSSFLLLAAVLRLAAADAPVSGSPAPEPSHPPSLPLWAGVAPGSEGKQGEKEQVTYPHCLSRNRPAIRPGL